MNRIVWVFGQSAAGKETFMKYAVANPGCELMRQLGYDNAKIIPVFGYPVSGCLEFDYDKTDKIEIVLDLIKKEANAVILIKWQHYDTGHDAGISNLTKLKSLAYNTQNEIICLSVESDVLYARLADKPWFDEKEAASFSREKMDAVVETMRSNIRKYLTLGFKLAAEIDATNGYKIIGNFI